jgi:bifunctional non-homologous end joining protein LigD
VVVPVIRKWSWEEHKAIAHAIVSDLARDAPDRYLTNMSKRARKGKVFLDYLRNGRGATAIAPYSTRARPGALVATPISWKELEQGAKPTDFDIARVVQRLQMEKEDPWAGMYRRRQGLTAKQVKDLLPSRSGRGKPA